MTRMTILGAQSPVFLERLGDAARRRARRPPGWTARTMSLRSTTPASDTSMRDAAGPLSLCCSAETIVSPFREPRPWLACTPGSR